MNSVAYLSRMALAMGMLAAASAAAAQQAAPAEPQADIIVTGTRTTGMKAADSPAPIQLLGSDVLQRSGQPDLVSSLSQNLPSVQAQAFGTDLQQINLQMKLRGMSPNHTLILVNGKRRHGTANVSVAGGPFGGSAAPDVSFILPDSIDHVEVLQDGAAAQYGTDAIAGVINFIQKKSDHGGSFTATGGRYMDQGGKSYTVSGNIGIAPFDGAYLNLTAGKTHKGFSFRGDIDASLHGDNSVAQKNLANYPLIPNNPYYPYFNRRVGDPRLDQTSIMYNAGYEFGDFEIYSFGSYGHKNAVANENSRNPSVITCTVGKPNCALGPNDKTNAAGTLKLFYPSGFQPQQRISETDYSFTGGFKGTVGDTHFDLASTYGRDVYHIYVQNSGNAELYRDTGFTPTTFFVGSLAASQWSNTLDLTHDFDLGLANPITVAAGLEYRHETYALGAGDSASYYGGGSQSFFGFSPLNASNNSRNNFSQYIDISVKPTDKWLIDGAIRHEHYSDFGDTTVFKLTSRYDFSDAIALRGTVSTGFRAPTLAEEFYQGINVSSNYVNGIFAPNSAAAAGLGFGNLKPEKSTNYSLGVVLHPLNRLTITIDGYLINLRNRIVMSSNFYGWRGSYCPLSDYGADGKPTRAGCQSVFNQNLYSLYNQQAVYNAMAAALGGEIPPATLFINSDPTLGRNTDSAAAVYMQTFVNGITMRTQGVDAVVTYASNFGDARVDWSLSANYNQNKVRKIYPLPPELYTSTTTPNLTVLQDTLTVASLEHSTPRFRATAGAFLTWGKFSANLQESFYSSTYTLSTPLAGSGVDPNSFVQTKVKSAFITNLELGYQIAKPIKISIGANNLFNKYPTQTPWDTIRKVQLANGSTSYAGSKYPTTSPFGYNGGYYYARIGLKF